MDYEPRTTPMHVSLHEVRLIAGAPRNAAVGVWTATLIILYGGVSSGLGVWAFAAVPVGMSLHKLLALWTKNDPLRPVIYARAYSREKNHYCPWPSAVVNRRSRPNGFGRGMLR